MNGPGPMSPASRKAVVLVSGGLDSATVLGIAKHEGFACHALSFDYGQRHRVELEAAAHVAAATGVVPTLCCCSLTSTARSSVAPAVTRSSRPPAMNRLADTQRRVGE